MGLFSIHNQKLKSINAKDFKLERDMQSLLENNIEEVYGLKFVSSEFQLNQLRVDTLAFDEESNSFVIIEYKRDKSSSVVDQGYAYLSLALNNKADFVLEYNEKTDHALTKSSIDWSATRVIFVAARFSAHQLGAINFQDLPIELWKVRIYEGDLLSVEQQIADKNSESIKTISKKSTSSDPVNKEIKTYTVDDTVAANSEMRDLYDSLSEQVLALDPNITEKPRKGYVGFWYKHKAFLFLNARKDKLILELNRTKPEDVDDPRGKVHLIPSSFKYKNRHISKIDIGDEKDLIYAMTIAEQVYTKLRNIFDN
jgi:predicted transport protein